MNPFLSAESSVVGEDLTTYERDAELVKLIQDGQLAQLSLENDWENLFPQERINAAESIAHGVKAKELLGSYYADAPETVIERMRAKHQLPSDVSVEDTLSAGYIGLYEAMHTWDYASINSEKTGFRSYASRIIKDYVLDNFENEQVVISGLMKKHIQDLARFAALSEQGLETNEIASTCNLDETTPVATKEMTRGYPALHLNPTEYVKFVKQFEQPKTTIGLSTSNERSYAELLRTSGYEQFVDERSDTTGNLVVEAQTLEFVHIALRSLTDRERMVVMKRFGLKDDGKLFPSTYQNIAAELSVSQERVRQIENRALSKLRHSSLYQLLLATNAEIDRQFILSDRKDYLAKLTNEINIEKESALEIISTLVAHDPSMRNKIKTTLIALGYFTKNNDDLSEIIDALENSDFNNSQWLTTLNIHYAGTSIDNFHIPSLLNEVINTHPFRVATIDKLETVKRLAKNTKIILDVIQKLIHQGVGIDTVNQQLTSIWEQKTT